MELLTKLGIDWKLLLAQMVNFLILLAVLYKFLYKPVIKMLEDRQNKIDKSLAQAEQINSNFIAAEKEREKFLEEARNEAGKVISESKEIANKLRDEAANGAKMEASRILEDAQKKMSVDRDAMISDIKVELADMVTTAVEKILKEKLDDKSDAKMIEKYLK
jgi:F-type H+-transporting ATPase subunit b